MAEIKTVGIVGLGVMGAGIAEVFARQGHQVIAVATDAAGLARGKQHLENSTGRAVAREKLTATAQTELLDRIKFSTELSELAGAQLVIEAIAEDLTAKQELLGKLAELLPVETILATSTSAHSVTEIAASVPEPGRVLGLHFFNPAPIRGLVEIARTQFTTPETIETVAAVTTELGKTPVVVGDKAGFIASNLLFPYLNHAARMFESKYATREDIDAAMRFGCGYPMGPLALLDLIGVDTAAEVLEGLYRVSGDRLHAPAPIFKQMISGGILGRKSGRGFYTYADLDSSAVVADASTPSADAKPQLKHDIKKVGVVGTGTMASGIVEVFAKSGFPVVYVGRSEEKVAGVKASIEKSLDKAIERGKLAEAEKAEILARLTGATSQDDLADVDIVVEAIAEDLEIKLELFKNLDRICKPGAILATTTSSLPIVKCAQATSRPQDVIGMHFFNPATIMRLVEVVTTVSTGQDVAETVRALCAQVGKVAVSCGDRAGFIVNALLFPYLNDAVNMLDAHYASQAEINTAMKQGCALPMGPFELLDVVGNDVSLAIQEELYAEFREPGFAPAPLLAQLVKAGYLGRKTKRGFADYTKR